MKMGLSTNFALNSIDFLVTIIIFWIFTLILFLIKKKKAKKMTVI